jgi:hypothetical protein
LHSHDRQEAPDTAEGMAAVVGDGWRGPGRAMERYHYMTRREARYGELIWLRNRSAAFVAQNRPDTAGKSIEPNLRELPVGHWRD